MKPTKEHTEFEVESWSKQKAKNQGWWVRKFASMAHRAVPDDIFAKAGRIFFVEFKNIKTKPSPLQAHEHEEMRAAGVDVFVIKTRDQFQVLLDAEEFKLEMGC